MVIFRENSEDIYAGIEWRSRARQAEEGRSTSCQGDGRQEDPLPADLGIGIKPVSREGTERLVRKAIAVRDRQRSRVVTLVHKGNIMKFTEGGFRDWGYALARTEFGARSTAARGQVEESGRQEIIVKDAIADAFLQQILLRPASTRDRDAEPERRLHLRRPGRARSAASASPRAPTCATRSRCSRPPTARRPSTRQGLREPRFRDPVG
jgi:hypothetical protein